MIDGGIIKKRTSTAAGLDDSGIENDSPNVSTASSSRAPTSTKRSTKYKLEDRRDSFIVHVETATEITRVLNQRKSYLRGAGLTLQPIPIFIGPLHEVEACYVQVNDYSYRVNTPLEAIDLCLKIFTALDCKYPDRASALWVFIKVGGFGIENCEPIRNRTINTLLGEIGKLTFPQAAPAVVAPN